MIQLKPNCKNRQYRLELKKGDMIILKRQIRSAEQLQKLIDRYKPINVYESCSTWLNPLNVRHKNPTRGYKIADYVLFDNMVFIDIDNQDPGEVKKVLNFFKKKALYTLWKLVSSGGGFHLYYHDLDKCHLKLHPLKRVEYIQNRREELEKELISAGIDLDKGIMTDIFRISRVIGTYNGNKKASCVEITPESLTAMTITKSHRSIEEEPETGVRVSSTLYYKFISNMIYGSNKQYIPYIQIKKERKYKRLIKELQDKYNLSDFYVFERDNRWNLLCLKAVSRRRLEKILKYSKSENLNQFIKYEHTWIRTSDILYADGKIELKDKFIEMIPKQANGFFSKPHAQFLNHRGITIPQHNFIGSDQNKIMIAKVKEAHT